MDAGGRATQDAKAEGSQSEAKTRILGQAFLVTFAATGKSDPPSRAEQMVQLTEITNLTQQINQQQISNSIAAPLQASTLTIKPADCCTGSKWLSSDHL